MSNFKDKYTKTIEEIQNKLKNPEDFEFVKDKINELAMEFVDTINEVKITDAEIRALRLQQNHLQHLADRVEVLENIMDEMESDIYDDDFMDEMFDDDDTFTIEDDDIEFEVVCPYCNYEFTADVNETEMKEEIQCPKCNKTIELDWNDDDFGFGCSDGGCSHCAGCGTDDISKHNFEDMQNNEEYNDDEDDM